MNIITLTGIGLFALLVGFILSYSDIKEVIRIRRTPIRVISALSAEGQVEVVGNAECENTLTSPLSRKSCVFWQIQVQNNAGVDIRGNWKWQTIYESTTSESFYVNDGTGKIKVLPANAKLLLQDELLQQSTIFNSLDPKIEVALKELGIDTSSPLNLTSHRVYERLIEPGEHIYVIGKIKYENEVKVIASGNDNPLIISDRSERELLKPYYLRIAINFLAGIIAGMGLLVISKT